MANGGGRCSSHGDGLSGDALARLGRGAEALPARLVANASTVSLRGDGGVVAVVEKRGGSSRWSASDDGELGAAAATMDDKGGSESERPAQW